MTTLEINGVCWLLALSCETTRRPTIQTAAADHSLFPLQLEAHQLAHVRKRLRPPSETATQQSVLGQYIHQTEIDESLGCAIGHRPDELD
jgi:hypothetical protein